MPIPLPPEREAMFRQIAERLGRSPADLIGDLILYHIERGTIEDRTDGVSMAIDGTHILFSITTKDGKKILGGFLDADDARRLANAIEVAAGTSEQAERVPAMSLFKIAISRAGLGVAFAQGSYRRVVAPPVAIDIVRQLRTAAASLEL